MTYLATTHQTSNALAVPPARYYHRASAWCDVLVYIDGDAHATTTVVHTHDEGAPMVTGGDLDVVGAIAAYLAMTEA